jgi:CubicO group peptidase (beta-lactamase class C family)
MSSQVFRDKLSDAEHRIAESMKFWNVPGAAIAVVTKDEVIFAKGYGFRDVAQGLPVTPKTVFPLASITKSFTAMDVALLVDEGKLSWDDPVKKHLPWFTLKDDYATTHLTVRDLLCHRSGLPRHDFMWYGTDVSREEGLRKLAHLEPSKSFREGWEYQNILYTAAGFLAGEIVGSSWEAFTKERILEPLGLEDTVCALKPFLKKANKALGYRYRNQTLNHLAYRNRLNAGPAGSIFSNVIDVATWLQLHLYEGSYQVSQRKSAQFASRKNLAEMHSPQMIIKNGEDFKKTFGTPLQAYGLGWFIQPYHDKTMIHHGGNIDGFSTLASFFPAEGIGIIVLANLDSTAFRRTITHTLYDSLFGFPDGNWDAKLKKLDDKVKREEEKKKQRSVEARTKNTKPSHVLKAFAGTYQHPGYADFVVRYKKGRLEGLLAGEFWRLKHYHYNVFELLFEVDDTKEKINFEVGESGKITSLEFKIEPALPAAKFERKIGKKIKG